jgi:hypothetical protein
MKNQSAAFVIATCILTAFVADSRLRAQQITGAIEGTITDSSGGLIVGAHVRAVNAATNLTVVADTSKEGAYQLPNLPSGVYTVTFTMNGFKTEEHSEVLVQANRTTTVQGRLEPGAVATTVEVRATPLLNQVDTTVGYVLDEQAIFEHAAGNGQLHATCDSESRRQRGFPHQHRHKRGTGKSSYLGERPAGHEQ